MRFPRDRHLIHPPVTGGTASALLHVNAVIEINNIRQLIDAGPMERLLSRDALSHRLQHVSFGPDLRMTGQAGFGGRQARESGSFDGGVAVTTIKTESGDVVLMAKWDGLRERHILFSRIRRSIYGVHDAPKQEKPEKHCHDSYSSKAVAAFCKDLSHGRTT